MSAKFIASRQVPPGFEIVVDNRELRAWNLWWNVKLTDDPEAWDDEIRVVNEMQSSLSELNADQRLIRAQMAEFCRMHPLFPISIDILCKEIGEGHFSKPVSVGCEGRGLLQALGRHGRESVEVQSRETLSECAQSLRKWLLQTTPESPRELKTFGFLGEITDHKEASVKRLLSTLQSEDLSISSLKEWCRAEWRDAHSSFEDLGCRPFNCFSCQEARAGETSAPGCQCCHCMVVDACLLCAGVSNGERSMSDQFNRFTEEYILAYSLAVNSWLEGKSPSEIKSLTAGRYLPRDGPSGIAERVHSSLAQKDRVKEWLGASLLKTIRDNQRWHRRDEVIDDFQEASSWLREKVSHV